MITAVFLCDKNWKIQNIMQTDSKFKLKVGDYLTDLINEPDILTADVLQDRVEMLKFPDFNIEISATLRFISDGIYVFLSHFETDKDYVQFSQLYEKGLEWARNHLEGLYHSEYYQISQLNNQLIDSKRALSRSNNKLRQAVTEIEETNKKLKEAEKTAENAMHMAQRANKLKTEFLANMSHDIRTPMNAILGLTHLMEYDIEDIPKMREYLSKLRATSRHLMGIVNDVLDISKIENGSVTLSIKSNSISDQINQIETLIRPQVNIRKQNLKIEFKNLTHDIVFCDDVRLRQVITNLLSNAVKYTPDFGEIYLGIEETIAEDGHCNYHFTVKDNGMGMTKEYLTHIFDPFSRSKESVASQIQGTGLGMAITYKIVNMMDGTITVDSEVGKGTRFDVFVTLNPDESQNAGKNVQNDIFAPGNNEELNEFTLKGISLLCSEDNELNAEILSSMLDMVGATYKICPDGLKMYEEFETNPDKYDAILTDIQMPVMNGYDAVRKIRSGTSQRGKLIPIIAMTANVFAEDVQKCLDAGMDAHIGKPVDMELLKFTLGKIFNNKE